MELKTLVANVESEWAPETGFFWRLRQGTFEPAALHRALSVVAAVPTPIDQEIPIRLVSVLWYIPIFMEWQTPRVREGGADMTEYAVATNKFIAEIERILGVP
jgi:hypothetical protein